MNRTTNGAAGAALAREAFLPVSRADMESRGWNELDFLLVSGDAYVDHPSFGHAIIARVLEKEGFRVGILAQPDYRSPDAFLALGRPRLGVLVSAGNLDSMLNAFTAAKKRRHTDSYSPGNRSGLRPDCGGDAGRARPDRRTSAAHGRVPELRDR